MKTQILKSFGIMALILMISIAINAQQIATQTREVGSFSGIHQSTSADVYITSGDKETVVVKADADAIDKLTTKVEDGILHIGSERNGWRNVRTMEVHITMRSLEKIKNSGSGDISVKGKLKGTNVYIGISGSGDLNADLDVNNLQVKISGSGDVKFSGVRGDLAVKISGSGDVYAEDLQLDHCTLESYGSGDVKLKGKAAKLSSKQSGSGDLNAYGLTAVEAVIKCNGSGDAVIQVVEKVVAVLNGSGDLTYHGTPEYVDVESNGSGEIYRK